MLATVGLSMSDIVASLDGLTDDELCTIVAHAQGILLDRPIPANVVPSLAVEVVVREESHLLAAYRAMAPLARRRLMGQMLRLVHAPRRLVRRHRPDGLALPVA